MLETFTSFSFISVLVGTVAFAILAPIIGCLLAGLDRIISARMQGRVGPPLLQPYYDVRKLLEKDNVTVSGVDGVYMTCALVFTAFAGGIFFSGGNLLMSAFVITMAALFFIMAAYSSRSPYSEIGAAREAIQVMSYEPMVLLMAVCFYMTVHTFMVREVFAIDLPVIVFTVPAFIGFMFILTIKLRKSPFDISMSHHAHQEIVRGVTTEMSGKTLAKVEIMHWCETVLFLGWTAMFFIWGNPLSIVLAIVVVLAIWFFEILIDNNFARVKWQAMLRWSWLVALICGGINMVFLAFI
ncbi:MAG: NADH-quinone oxidoreductase subunit H [Eggerthellaceae bacterium]|nr:NADH-quinone oxidoreductase subunit H [Eggerthellaceae bacterium]